MGVLAHVVPKTPPRKMCQKPHPEKNRKKPVLTGKSQQPPPENSQGQIIQECVECVECQECVECVECVECQECVECVECVECQECVECVECVECAECQECVECNITGTFPGDHSRVIF